VTPDWAAVDETTDEHDHSPATLELTSVSLERDGTTILDDVTWTVHRGQRWVVLGPNGSGKSTVVRIAAQEVFIGGHIQQIITILPVERIL